MDVLSDVNFIFSLVAGHHRFHTNSQEWLDAQGSDVRVAICRHTQMALIRLLSNPSAMNGEPLTLPKAWRLFANLMRDPSMTYFPEPMGFQSVWLDLCEPHGASPNVLADAYLAAMAIQAGIPLVTLDKNFKAFPGLEVILLS
jgi:toxin-antitoxin system PIN domain toxin